MIFYNRQGKAIGESIKEPAVRKMVEESNRVMLTRVSDAKTGKSYEVSTVFLSGIDHGHGCTPNPILFETMIFLDPDEGEFQERYCTEGEAKDGHILACLALASTMIEPEFEELEG